MKTRTWRRVGTALTLATLVAWGPAAAASASAPDREARWAELLGRRVDAAQLQQLEAGGERFLGLYKAPAGDRLETGLVVLHDRGGHPDWPYVVRPLRLQLARARWATLSVQLPVLAPDAPLAEYAAHYETAAARIRAAAAYLREQGAERVFLIGYGLGAAMAAWTLAEDDPGAVSGLVGISLAGDASDPHLDTRELLQRVGVPILDIYGQRDRQAVLRAAQRRAELAKAGALRLQQIEIIGAGYRFTHHAGPLAKHIRGWVRRIGRRARSAAPAPEGGAQ